MKKLGFNIFLLFINIFLIDGQEFKKVLIKNQGITECYYVDKATKQIKEGRYFLKFQADTLITGAYRSNKPVGIWRIFGSHKELELIYNYDSSLVSYFKFPSDENLNYDHINRPPVCMKGFNNLKLLTAINSSFPPDLEQIGKFELNVTVIFNINKQGIPEGFYISDSSGNLTIDKQPFKDIKTSVEKEIWLPALDKSNRPISYNLKLSLKYRVN